MPPTEPMGLFIQPACLQHKFIRHANSSHIFERPERLRAVLLGVAAAAARLEELEAGSTQEGATAEEPAALKEETGDDLTSLLSSLSIASSASPPQSHTFSPPSHLAIVPPPLPPSTPGQILLHHPALQLSHIPPPEAPFPYAGPAAKSSNTPSLSSSYMRDLLKWATEAPEKIKTTGCEIPGGLGLNQGDLYLGPGSVLAIEGAVSPGVVPPLKCQVQTVCQAVDTVFATPQPLDAVKEPSTPPASVSKAYSTPPAPHPPSYFPPSAEASSSRPRTPAIKKAFCAIRPPGHHCGEDAPSGFCYVNNVVVGAMHAYLEHDVDRAIVIDFDLHHGALSNGNQLPTQANSPGNGTQALVMPFNAASYAEDIAVKAGKPPSSLKGKDGSRRRGWKGFYGSVHDIYSYPCEDGELDLIKDASLSLAAHGQYIENIHLQPYTSEADFYLRIYPKYLALLDKAKAYMDETEADPERTVVLISAGFDACEHEHQAMQRHDRRVPVSFFSRYTRDIAKFADQHCRGRVVSVLEGGYSDRALTSAAMGHVVGMLGHEGRGDWWNKASLDDIERATKKKRTGKIAPFPTELSHIPHLCRTHALLAHFETVGLPPDLPSALSTPQHAPAGRWMTLRTRKANGEEDETPPPPVARRGRGRGAGTPTVTPRGKKAGSPKLAASSSAPALLRAATAGAGEAKKEAEVDDIVGRMGKVGLEEVDSEAALRDGRTLPTAIIASSSDAGTVHPATNIPSTNAAVSSEPASDKRIFLRFKRPTPSTETSPTVSPSPSTSLYPPLPPSTGNTPDRKAYREASAETSTSGEYVTASSGEDRKD